MKHAARATGRRATGDRGANSDSRGASRAYAQLPYWIVLAAIGLGLVLMQSGGQAVSGGTLVIAGALLAGSVLRLALPEDKAGMLGSRRRLADAAVMTALGVGLLIAGLIVQVPS